MNISTVVILISATIWLIVEGYLILRDKTNSIRKDLIDLVGILRTAEL